MLRRGLTLAIIAVIGLIVLGAGAPGALAENVDPAGSGFKYAWSENAGWINAEPSGNGGPGMQVEDFEVTGWLWAENAGWISLSCRNDSSCDTVFYRTYNDGAGVLSGYAWSENAGWVNWAPSFGGVVVNVVTGELSGRAWSENLGWITFRGMDTGSGSPYGVTTSWNCAPAPPAPTGIPLLTMTRFPDTVVLEWTAVPGATGYDVIRGDIETLLGGTGFYDDVEACHAENQVDLVSADDIGSGISGMTYWLVRPVNCGSAGTWNSGGTSQFTDRDPQITAESIKCQ